MFLDDKDYLIWQTLNIHEGYHSPKFMNICLACNCLHKTSIFWITTITLLNSFASTLLSSPELAADLFSGKVFTQKNSFLSCHENYYIVTWPQVENIKTTVRRYVGQSSNHTLVKGFLLETCLFPHVIQFHASAKLQIVTCHELLTIAWW